MYSGMARDDVELASFHDEIFGGVFVRCRYGCVSAPRQSSSIGRRSKIDGDEGEQFRRGLKRVG